MDEAEKARFLDAVSQAAKMLELAQAQLQRARAQCAGSELHERVDLVSKRAFELKVKAEWLCYTVQGKIEPTEENRRRGSDRRVGVDRRLIGMQKLMLAVG